MHTASELPGMSTGAIVIGDERVANVEAYDALIDNMPDGFALLVAVEIPAPAGLLAQAPVTDFRFIRANRMAGLIAAPRPGPVVGMLLSELAGSPSLSPMIDACRRVLVTGQPETLELALEDSRRAQVTAYRPIGGQIAIVLRDVTQAYLTSEELRRSEQRFRDLYERAPLGYQSLDIEGHFIEVNDAWLASLGYSREEVIGRWFGDFLVGPYVEHFRQSFPRFKAAGEIHGVEFVMRRRDGSQVAVAFDGRISYNPDGTFKQTHCILADITARRQADLERQLYSERLRVLRELDEAILAEHSPERIAEAAISHLRVLMPGADFGIISFDVTAGTARFLAVAANEQPTTGFRDPWPLEYMGDLADLTAGRSVRFTDHAFGVDASSTPFEIEIGRSGARSFLSVPMLAEEELIGLIGVRGHERNSFNQSHQELVTEVAGPLAVALLHARLRDSLQRQARELETRVAERTAQLTEAVDDMEAFSYTVAHDLRAPLRAVGGFAQALIEDYGEHFDEVGRDHARRLVSAAERMDSLIQDLLAYSRLSRRELPTEPVRLRASVDEAVDALHAQIAGSKEQIEIIEPLYRVRANSRVLAESIYQLLSNALKFVEPGCRPSVRVSAERRAGAVCLSIADNGIGIAPEHQQNLSRVRAPSLRRHIRRHWHRTCSSSEEYRADGWTSRRGVGNWQGQSVLD